VTDPESPKPKRKSLLPKRDARLIALTLVIAGLVMLVPWFWRLGRLAYHQHVLLSTQWPGIAVQHAKALRGMGGPGVRVLLKVLRKGEPHVREIAAMSLSVVEVDDDKEIVSALREAATRDLDPSVRVRAGYALYRRGVVQEGLSHYFGCLKLEPMDSAYHGKHWLAIRCRILEAVEALIVDARSLEAPGAAVALNNLYDIATEVDETARTLPELKWWNRHGLSKNLTDAKRAAVLGEFQTWWKKHRSEFRSMQSVLDGKEPLVPESK